ncbi:MAG TPA: TspO/MBR family protein [Atopostipes sp.]|nr:TspO/MBR family protein [Atopostipes sp.]
MDTKKKIGLNAIFFILTLVVNTLGGLGIINDMSQSDVSDKYFTLITPAGFTFSIWSVIYGLIAVSLVVLYLRRETSYYQRVLDKITPLFILTSVLNMAWIVLFSYELVELSTLFIFAYTIVLSLICKQLLAINDGKHFLLPLTFGLNTGWLMIATVVNVASSLVKLEWNGFGLSDDLWGMIILLVAILIVIFVTTQTQNAAIPLPIAWAYFGTHQSLATEHPGDYGILQLIAIIGLVVLIGVAAIQLYKNEYFILPKTPNDSNRLTTK